MIAGTKLEKNRTSSDTARRALRIALTLILFSVGALGPAARALAQEIQSQTATIQPSFGEQAPLLEAPPVHTAEQRALVEQALRQSHLPVSIPEALGAADAVPGSPASEPALPPAAEAPGPQAPNDFTIFQNNLYSPDSGFSSTTNEPSVAQGDNVVFYTGNWYAGVSTNHGQTLNFIDPFTGPFAPVNGGFCCDQVVIYDPSRDAIFYLQQYIKDGTTGTQRINVDTDADGDFECSYDWTPQTFGRPNGEWLDFPDLVLGANSLYHVSNMFTTATNSFTASVIARYPLDSIATCGGFSYNYLVTTDRGSLRPTHGAGTTMYWGTHNSTSSLRIYRWTEGDGTIFFDDRGVTAWVNGGSSCPGPDGNDFTAFGDGRILASWVSGGVIGFMWRSAQHGGFPRPYVRVARFDETTKNLINEPTIWDSTFCWAYPSVGVNSLGELGGTILVGSATSHMQCQAWIADGVNGGTIAPLENVTVAQGIAGPASNRSGDYLTARGHENYFTETWVGTCFTYPESATGNADPRFVWWGRESDGGSTHACCNTGAAGCIDSAIEAAVCAADPYCCNTSWDSLCVGEVTSVAGENCNCCLSSSSAEGCYDAATFNAVSDCVCAFDSYCCTDIWDSICVDEVESLGCGVCNEEPQCNDGIDNDADGLTDLADPGCRDSLGTVENPACDNGLDDDGDGKIDWDGAGFGAPDPQCGTGWHSTEEMVTCGLGAELAFLLPPLLWLRQRRRGTRA